MRLMLIVVIVAVAMLLDIRVSQAAQMPWCARTNTGGSTFHYNCTLPTFELCVQEVIAGNGFCSPNPSYRGPEFVRPGPSGSDIIIDPCKLSVWGSVAAT
jgi:hypothetical protein